MVVILVVKKDVEVFSIATGLLGQFKENLRLFVSVIDDLLLLGKLRDGFEDFPPGLQCSLLFILALDCPNVDQSKLEGLVDCGPIVLEGETVLTILIGSALKEDFENL